MAKLEAVKRGHRKSLPTMDDVEWSRRGRTEREKETMPHLINGGRRNGLASPALAGFTAARSRPASQTAGGRATIGDMP